MNKKNKKITAVVLLTFSLLGNIAWLLSDGLFEATVIKTKIVERYVSPTQPNLEQFRKSLVEGSLEMLEGRELSPRPLPYKHSTARANFQYNIKGYDEHTALFYWGGGWLMCSLLESAIKTNDMTTIRKVEEIFKAKVLNEPINKVDQSLFGIVSIVLTNLNGGGKTQQ